MINRLINKLLKPENPIDLDIYTKLPREKYNFFERIKILFIAIKSKDRNSLNFFFVIIRYVIIRLLLLIFFPLTLIIKILKFKLVIINYWQIGTSMLHLINLDRRLSLRKDNFKYLIYFPKIYTHSFIIKKRFKNFTFIENKFLCFILYIFFHSNILRLRILEFDEHYKNSESFYLNYLSKRNDYNINFLDREVTLKFQKILKKQFNLLPEEKIITINVRNKYFYHADNSKRNAEISTYAKAINYLLKKNYKIFHFGNSRNDEFKDIVNKKNYYFLNVKDKNFSLDLQIYLIGISKFFICTNSGPYAYGHAFNVPVLLTNLYPFHGFFSYNYHDIVIPKLIKYKNKPLNFKKILNNDLCFRIPQNNFFEIIDNTEKDIFLGVLEIEKKIRNKSFKVNKFNSKILDENHPNRYGLGNIGLKFMNNHSKYFL